MWLCLVLFTSFSQTRKEGLSYAYNKGRKAYTWCECKSLILDLGTKQRWDGNARYLHYSDCPFVYVWFSDPYKSRYNTTEINRYFPREESNNNNNNKNVVLRHYAASRKVAGSSPDEVDFLNWPNPSGRTGPGVDDSASNRNEYQESLKN
jgi:hypothetical protein